MIYVLWGADDFSIAEAVRRLVSAALPTDTADLNLTRLPAAEVTIDALRFACEAAPLLADRRVVVVSGLLDRLTARRGKEKAGGAEDQGGLAAALAAYLPRVPANTLLILVEPVAPPKSGVLAKALDEAGARVKAFATLAGPPLVRWIEERARASGADIAGEAAALLATFVGSDLRALANEIAKLAAYAGPGRTIAPADVTLLVSQAGEASVFELVDAIGQGNRRTALSALHTLLEHGERPERIMVMVGRQVRLLLQVKDLLGGGAAQDAIGRELGLSPYPLRKLVEQARLFQVPQLAAMHRRVLEADVQVKTGQLDSELGLQLLVAELSGEAKPAPRPGATRRTWRR
jgi:DNA polymerase-3 subunit delta